MAANSSPGFVGPGGIFARLQMLLLAFFGAKAVRRFLHAVDLAAMCAVIDQEHPVVLAIGNVQRLTRGVFRAVAQAQCGHTDSEGDTLRLPR